MRIERLECSYSYSYSYSYSKRCPCFGSRGKGARGRAYAAPWGIANCKLQIAKFRVYFRVVIRRGKKSSPKEIAPHKKSERWPRGRVELTRLIPLPPIPLPKHPLTTPDAGGLRPYTANPTKLGVRPPQATRWQGNRGQGNKKFSDRLAECNLLTRRPAVSFNDTSPHEVTSFR